MFGKRECRRVSRLLWDYAAGRLPETDRRRVERHLPRCPACRVEAEGHWKAVSLLAAYREQAVPESMGTWHALRSRLESPERPAAAAPLPRRAPYMAWSGVLAAALLLCWIGVEQGRRAGDNPFIGLKSGANLMGSDEQQTQTGSTHVAQKSTPETTPADGSPNAVPTEVAPDGGQIGLGFGDQKNRPTLAKHGQTLRKPRRHRPNRMPSVPRHPFVQRPGPSPEAPPLRLAHDTLTVDGPVVYRPPRDFVISPALLPSGAGTMRHYVMDSISLSSSHISHASHEQGGEEIKAW